MASKCEHYRTKELVSKTLTPDRNPRKPTIKHSCDHDNSKHNGKTLTGEAICNGDIKECDIPENER